MGGLARYRQRQRDIFSHAQVIEELTILMHNPDTAARFGHAITIQIACILPEQAHLSAGCDQFAVAQFQKRCFSRARRPCQKVERPWHKLQVQRREKLCSAITIGHIVEFNHACPRSLNLGLAQTDATCNLRARVAAGKTFALRAQDR